MRKSLPVMNAPSGPIRSAPTVPTSAVPDGAELDQASVSLAARAGEFVSGERGEDDAGAERVDPGAALTQRTASAITRSEFPRLASW
jgi:hypothetical protein